MSTIDWERLRECYRAWQQLNQITLSARSVDALGYTVQKFAELLRFAQHQNQSSLVVEEREFIIALAICILGPDSAQVQTERAWQLLCGVVSMLGEPEHCLETVIAWGCGWGRPIQPKAEDVWERRWTNAIFAFCSLVERSVHYTVRCIAQRLMRSSEVTDLFRAETKQDVQERVRSYAELIGLELIHNRCSCSLPKSSDQPHCDQTAHQLLSWRPEECSLAAFIAQAVRGRATAGLLVGAFVKSALYPRLKDDIGVVISEVEFKRCINCGTLYEANHCPNPTCKHIQTDIQQIYRLARKNWLLIPYEHGGNYQMVKRWRCRQCGNLFSLNLTHCPREGGERSQRPTNIWIYFDKISAEGNEANNDFISGDNV